jgi:GntR family transcriptional regulator, carbon starvation induced regulator
LDGSHQGNSSKPTMSSQLIERIRADIISGDLVPGKKLVLKDIADYYSAGVIPLREALSRLAANGFINIIDQKGFRVSELSSEELKDITRVRLLIECQALRDSIAKGDVEWESRLLAAHHRLTRLPVQLADGDKLELNPAWEVAHEAFYRALISACDSDWLHRFARTLRDQTLRYRQLAMRYSDSKVRNVPEEHARLMDAVLERNADEACAILTDHYESTTRSVLIHEFPVR